MQQRYGMRWRILAAGVTMIAWMIVYSVLAVTVIGWIDVHPLVEGLLYAGLGIAWIFPMIWLFKWAAKDDIAG
ncbi:MAG: DUF2842 domain-containing protein [Alphaproteobacteria bacterium]|nr:DUF2842 domain-containing protein [Alphaproteobacteria bacterium]